MIGEFKEAWEAASKLAPGQVEAYKTWVVVKGIGEVSYYIILALVVVAVGRRLINATMSAMRAGKQ